MRAFLGAADALDDAARDATADRSRDVIDQADTKALAAMALRRHLEGMGWVAPRETASAESND
jgi:hypothetical protein